MSVIKEIYDVATDAAALKQKRSAIKRALKAELKLNHKLLVDVKSATIDDARRIDIIRKLDIEELKAAVKYDIPYSVISRQQVSEELAQRYKVKRLVGKEIGHLIEALYINISYLKKDYDRKGINLTMKLYFVYKYNGVLVELLK